MPGLARLPGPGGDRALRAETWIGSAPAICDHRSRGSCACAANPQRGASGSTMVATVCRGGDDQEGGHHANELSPSTMTTPRSSPTRRKRADRWPLACRPLLFPGRARRRSSRRWRSAYSPRGSAHDPLYLSARQAQLPSVRRQQWGGSPSARDNGDASRASGRLSPIELQSSDFGAYVLMCPGRWPITIFASFCPCRADRNGPLSLASLSRALGTRDSASTRHFRSVGSCRGAVR